MEVFFSFPSINFGNVKFLPGIKFGLNYSRMVSLQDGIGIKGYGFPKFSYPAGFFGEAFSEFKITDYIYIINEISYNNVLSKMTIYTGEENILNQELTLKHIRTSCLIKVESNLLPYLLVGIDLGYLLNAKYRYFYEVTNKSYGSYDIQNVLPSIDSSIKIGIGKKIKLFNENYLIGETIGIIGLNKYKYFDLGAWKNNSLQFILGIQRK